MNDRGAVAGGAAGGRFQRYADDQNEQATTPSAASGMGTERALSKYVNTVLPTAKKVAPTLVLNDATSTTTAPSSCSPAVGLSLSESRISTLRIPMAYSAASAVRQASARIARFSS